MFFHSWIVSKPKVTLKLTENKKTNKNCQTSCIQGEQRPIDFIFRGDKKREGAGVNRKLTIWRKYLKIIGRNQVYFAIPNFTVNARFQSADRWIYEKKYPQITEIKTSLIWRPWYRRSKGWILEPLRTFFKNQCLILTSSVYP